MVKIPDLKIVVGASYDDSGPDIFAQSDKKHEKESRLGRLCQHTYLLHSSSFPDINKFLVPLGCQGLATSSLAFEMMNILKSNYKGEIAVIGNRQVGMQVEAFNQTYRPEGKYFVFTDEGDNLSLGNTISKGAAKKGTTLFMCGDIPYFIDLDSLLQDPDIHTYAATADLNCRELMFPEVDQSQLRDNGFFQRNYHLIVLDDRLSKEHPIPRAIKEANVYSLDYNIVAEKIDLFYSGRKSATGKNKEVFFKLLFEDGKWREALDVFAMRPSLALGTLLKFAAKKFLSKYAESKKEAARLKYSVRLSDLERLATIAVGAPVKIKMEHAEAGRVMDIDSYHDWAFMRAMLENAKEPNKVYPYWDDLKSFAALTPEFVKQGIKMLDTEYINWLFSQHQTLKGKEPFDNKGRFRNTLWEEERIAKANEHFKKFIAKLQQRRAS
ncbi:Uncharacterised protein [uncultured archaeon]|nr:Uncharacterised protein [uncultured archaeon]